MATSREKSMTPRQIARREAILDTVRAHLLEGGYEALSMRNIAAAAGVSPSTLYEIYDSKESLILIAVGSTLGNLSQEEEQYEPGLDRFLHRLDSVASFITDHPEIGEAMTKLLFQSTGESMAREVLMVNAVAARRTSLEEMRDQKEIDNGADIEFYARTLVSVTWGSVLLWQNDMLSLDQFRNEFVRASLTAIQPIATRKSKPRINELLNDLQ